MKTSMWLNGQEMWNDNSEKVTPFTSGVVGVLGVYVESSLLRALHSPSEA